ncbi:hypothetical protein KAS31_01700 [Candidatus Parcubacteria bacterium]|nr:hypothetical protein [Candidatus Parcubacteria bacterium]
MDDEDKKIENNNSKKNSKEFKGAESKSNIREKEEKEMWDAVCEMCGEKIKVPFKPDPKRSTYCKDCLMEARKQTTEPVRDNETNNKDIKKEEEKKEIHQIENKEVKEEIKTVDSRNNFAGKDIKEKEEKSFSVSNNFSARKMENKDEPNMVSSIKDKELKNKDHKNKTKEDDMNLQRESEPQEKISDTAIKDDSDQKSVGIKKTSQVVHEPLPESKDLEIKEGEIIKF